MQEIITLSNGKRVANFSSPHPFTFTDGSILPAVVDSASEYLKVQFNEFIDEKNGDVELTFELTQAIRDEMAIWINRWLEGKVDVIFCPLPMLVAIANDQGEIWLKSSPFRGIRMEDRIKKLASIDKQCLAKGQM